MYPPVMAMLVAGMCGVCSRPVCKGCGCCCGCWACCCGVVGSIPGCCCCCGGGVGCGCCGCATLTKAHVGRKRNTKRAKRQIESLSEGPSNRPTISWCPIFHTAAATENLHLLVEAPLGSGINSYRAGGLTTPNRISSALLTTCCCGCCCCWTYPMCCGWTWCAAC